MFGARPLNDAELLEQTTIARLLAFRRVAQAGGFALAAPDNPPLQSQLNRQVRQLEEALKVQLIEREGRGVVVTPAGLRLSGVLADLIGGLQGVQALRHGGVLELTLTGGDSVLQWLVLPTLAQVSAAVPGSVRFTLRASADALLDVTSGLSHFGLARGGAKAPELSFRALGELKYAIFVPQTLAPKGTLTVAAVLNGCPIAVVAGEAAMFSEAFGGAAFAPTLVCETYPQAAQAVATGAYAAILPSIAAETLAGIPVTRLPLKLQGAEKTELRLVARTRVCESQPAVQSAFLKLAQVLKAALAARP